MAEYIERRDALSDEPCAGTSCQDCPFCSDNIFGGCKMANFINSIPAADVAPVQHGEWFISIGNDGKPVGTICPICGFAWSEAIDAVKLEPCLALIKTPYCPNCGASMNLEEQT